MNTLTQIANPTPRTLVDRKGNTIQSALTDQQALAICAGLNKPFAQDLVAKNRSQRNGLSAFQMFWVHKIALDANKPAPTPAAPVAIGTLGNLIQFFNNAQQALRYPKVTLVAGSFPVEISIAGARSKYAGQVMVTDGERYPNNRFWGRVDLNGDFHPGRNCPDEVVALVAMFAADPAGTAAAYGKLTGNCCFCRKDLNDPRSTEVGYGPVCAKHYGLPWGN